MTNEISKQAQNRGIVRLCHFTPSRNLGHILSGKVGILATQHLKAEERSVLNATDLARMDGHADRICCSISYPNAWYFSTARNRLGSVFRDWVVLLIRPHYLWHPDTLFCPVNAAYGGGRFIDAGVEAFEALFASAVPNPRAGTRRARHLAECPTDDQAEVLIKDCISQGDIIAVAVASATQAALEASRLPYLGVEPTSVAWVVAPTFYDPRRLATEIRMGIRPSEKPWTPDREQEA